MVVYGNARALEGQRVERHLLRAERLLARRDASSLDPVQRSNRSLLLAELARYRRAGRFPRNTERASGLTPIFRDGCGTHCAVAHLLAITGHGEIVDRVAGSRNLARVRELADLPELGAWLLAAGLTLEEAALIQPSYCFDNMGFRCFCSQAGRDVVGQGVIVAEGEDSVTLSIERIAENKFGVMAGAELESSAVQGALGERVLVQIRRGPDATLLAEQVGGNLEIGAEEVTCHDRSGTGSVPIDTALGLLQSSHDQCQAALESRDPMWGTPPGCDDGCACRLALGDGGVAPALTGLAMLTALLLRRSRMGRRLSTACREC